MSSWISVLPSKSSGRSAGNLIAPVERLRDANNTVRSPSIRNRPSAMSVLTSDHLDDHRGPHAAACTHRQHADSASAPSQFVDRGGDHAGPGGGDRVAEAD